MANGVVSDFGVVSVGLADPPRKICRTKDGRNDPKPQRGLPRGKSLHAASIPLLSLFFLSRRWAPAGSRQRTMTRNKTKRQKQATQQKKEQESRRIAWTFQLTPRRLYQNILV